MAFPTIFYKNVLRESGVTLTDPGTAVGYDVNDIKDQRPASYWKSSGVAAPIHFDIDTGASGKAADYVALVNHNINSIGATIRVLSGASSPAATERLAATVLGENTVSVKTWSSPGAQRYWRVTINHASPPFSAAPFVGELMLGLKLVLPEHFAPDGLDPYMTGIDVAGERAAGQYLGVTNRGKTHRSSLSFGAAGAARSWWLSDGNAWFDYLITRRPFILILDTDDTEFDDGKYIKLDDSVAPARLPVGSSWHRLQLVGCDVEDAYREPAQ